MGPRTHGIPNFHCLVWLRNLKVVLALCQNDVALSEFSLHALGGGAHSSVTFKQRRNVVIEIKSQNYV